MGTLSRQWLILKTFPQKGKISTTALRDRLATYGVETTLRTIQRDLVFLGTEFQLECDENNPAGWSWPKDRPAFDISNMDPATALTFTLAQKHLEHMFPRGAMEVLEPYFKAANVRLRRTTESSFSHWPDKVRVVSRNLPMQYPEITENIRDTVYTAVLEERRFNAKYRALGGTVRDYDVNPLGMAFVEGLTYLIATLNEHEDPILLLLHRMVEAKPTEVPVTIPEGFNLDEYIDEELKFPIGDDIKLKALFSDKADVERLRETPISDDQTITGKTGGWLLQATVGNSYQLRWWLRGYGERVEVVGPKNLRQEFLEMAQKLANLYVPVGNKSD